VIYHKKVSTRSTLTSSRDVAAAVLSGVFNHTADPNFPNENSDHWTLIGMAVSTSREIHHESCRCKGEGVHSRFWNGRRAGPPSELVRAAAMRRPSAASKGIDPRRKPVAAPGTLLNGPGFNIPFPHLCMSDHRKRSGPVNIDACFASDNETASNAYSQHSPSQETVRPFSRLVVSATKTCK
jgi:hypothetical protein